MLSAPGNSADLTLGAIVGEADARVAQEIGKAQPVVEEVVYRLADDVVPRKLSALLTHPALEFVDHWRDTLLARRQTFFGGLAVDLTLDIDDAVDPFESFHGQQGHNRLLAVLASQLTGDGDELEELAATMRPAVRTGHRLTGPAVF